VGGEAFVMSLGGAAVFGGRPRLGGWATWTSGGEKQAFSLSVETFSALFPICSLKVLSDRSKTRKGPS
jgi:hypothetical protein